MNLNPLHYNRLVCMTATAALLAACGINVPAAMAAPQAGDKPAAVPVARVAGVTAAATTLTGLGTATENAAAVEATVIQRTPDKDGKLTDKAKLKVSVAASGVARVERQGLQAEPNAAKQVLPNATLAIFDGKQTFEYDAESHKYLRFDPLEGGTPRSLFIPVRPIWLAARGLTDRAVQSAPEETLDGRRMLVKNSDITRAGESHPLLRQRYLIDAETNLLRRQELILWQDDAPRVITQYDFSDWVVHKKPLPAERFAWHPPAGAVETALPKPPPAPPRPALLAAGTIAPDFTCLGADGKPVKLSDLRGKVVILDFWATWCGPCQRSMPHLQRVYDQVKDKNVTVLALSVSDLREDYDKWLVQHKSDYTFPIAYDTAGRDASKNISATLFKVSGIPTQYVIDKDGKVAATLVGYMGNSDHRLEEELGKLGVTLPVEQASSATP